MIAPVPVHCFSVTFTIISKKDKLKPIPVFVSKMEDKIKSGRLWPLAALISTT